jgi:arylsulfatase A-like enzyme
VVGNRPNILYLHSHDTGRYTQPYGEPVPMPNVQALADQGVLFREAFCAAPTCSASRACLLTGQYGQSNGMMGLAHRGWSLRDYRHHIVHTLRKAGYTSTLIGEQHISKRPDVIGYDEVMKIPTNRVESVAAALPVRRLLRDPPRIPASGRIARRSLLQAPGEPAGHAGGPRRRRSVQGERALARPGRRHGAQPARRVRP